MDLFKGQNLIEFAERFKTNEDCIEYLAYLKWSEGYKCVKCGHSGSQIRANSSRTCNKCSHTESATANTLFHKVKFGVRKAFFICFEMATSTKSLSASYIAVRFGVTEKTARLFMHKVREAMKSRDNSGFLWQELIILVATDIIQIPEPTDSLIVVPYLLFLSQKFPD